MRCRTIVAALSLAVLGGCLGSATAGATPALPAPLGLGHQQLSPGLHVLDLVARELGHPGPSSLPRIAITLPKRLVQLRRLGHEHR